MVLTRMIQAANVQAGADRSPIGAVSASTPSGAVHGAATSVRTIAPTTLPAAVATSGSAAPVSRSNSRKYVAWQAAAPSPASRPIRSSDSPVHTSTTQASPARAMATPTIAVLGTAVPRTNLSQPTT